MYDRCQIALIFHSALICNLVAFLQIIHVFVPCVYLINMCVFDVRVSLIVFEIIVCLAGSIKCHMGDVLSLISVINDEQELHSTIFQLFLHSSTNFLIEC